MCTRVTQVTRGVPLVFSGQRVDETKEQRWRRVVVIGATGHVGGYLVPRLVRAGHDVVAVSRGDAPPYRKDPAWQQVERRRLDRGRARRRRTGSAPRSPRCAADVVVDLICFTLPSARQLVEAVAGEIDLLVHVGTVWTHGHSVAVPTTEEAVKRPFGAYGIQKAEVEAYLLRRARRHGSAGHRSSTRATSSEPAGCRSTRPGTSTRRCTRRSPGASRSPCPTSVCRRCTTCTPTTSPRWS